MAIVIGVIGVALLSAGIFTVMLMRDLNALVGGMLAIGYSASVLWPERARWKSWRSIGILSLEMDDLNIVPGEISTCRIRAEPRSDGIIKEIAVVFGYRDSRGGAGASEWQVDFAAPDPQLRAGVAATFIAEVMLPPGVPPSRFESGFTRQWTVTGVVTLIDGRSWQRDYPVMVYPTP